MISVLSALQKQCRRSSRRAAAALFVALPACFAVVLSSPAAVASPYDIVPRGDIAYDLLGALAAAGRVSGATLADLFRGDRLYTRREMAGLVLRVRREAESLSPEQETQLSALEIAFEPELRQMPDYPGRFRPDRANRGTGALTGQIKARVASSPTSGDLIARFSGTVSLGPDGYGTLSAGNYRDEWYSDDGFTRGGYPTIETAFARINTRAIDITIGRRPLRWGPGYSGAMHFSDEAPSVPMVQLEKGFRFPGWLGQRLGRLYFTQFAGEFFENDIPNADPVARGTRRYLFGRRIETQEAGRWTVSLGESFKSTRLPDATYAFLLPSFYLYQDTYTRMTGDGERPLGFIRFSDPYPNTAWLNYVADTQVSYRVDSRGTVVYTDLMLDDIKAPSGFGLGNEVPRKIGFQAGVYAPALDKGGRYAGRLEVTTIDPDAYTSASAPVFWYQNGKPLAYPSGPNATTVFGRLDATLSGRLRTAVEGSLRRPQRDGSGNAAPANNSFDADRFSLFATYAFRRDAFAGLRLDYTRVSGVAVPGGGDSNTRAEVNLGFGF